MSSDNKYIILKIAVSEFRFRFDVRPANDLERSVHKTGVVDCYYSRYQCSAYINNGELYYQSDDAVYRDKMAITEED